MNYIIWNNKDSREIQGLIICELPPITKPQMRVTETIIDGVDGSVIEELGYESYDKTIAIGLKAGADIDSIIEYFTGSGDIVFSNEPDKYYKARIIQRIDFSRLLRYKMATVTFRVQPFKYAKNESSITSTSGEMAVTNSGNYASKPVITIKGSGLVYLSVNSSIVCTYSFPTDEDTVIIDSEKQDAYFGNVLKNRNMTGKFPILSKGENTISCLGATSITIDRYSRWL